MTSKYVVVYKAYCGMDLKSVAGSRDVLVQYVSRRKGTDRDPASDNPSKQWRIESENECLQIIEGNLVKWSDDEISVYHVIWKCPICSKIHDANAELDNSSSLVRGEQSPVILPCDDSVISKATYYLVRWKDELYWDIKDDDG